MGFLRLQVGLLGPDSARSWPGRAPQQADEPPSSFVREEPQPCTGGIQANQASTGEAPLTNHEPEDVPERDGTVIIQAGISPCDKAVATLANDPVRAKLLSPAQQNNMSDP